MQVDELVHEIHSSEIRAFLECRLSWYWQYRQHWSPIKTPKPLEFGRSWHAGLEALYNPNAWPAERKQLFNRAWEAFSNESARQLAEYLDRIGQYQPDPEEQRDYLERLELGRNMLANLVRSIDREKYTPVAVEEEFQVPLGNLRCKCDDCWNKWTNAKARDAFPNAVLLRKSDWKGLPVVFVCCLDAIFADRAGSLWVVDHKSAAALLSREDADLLELDLQLGHYIWALWKLGHPAGGAVYNQFRKTAPHAPRELQNSQDGRRYSVNRLQLTDYHTALKTFRRDKWAFTRGLYDEYLEWLKTAGKEYFREFRVPKTPGQLLEIQQELYLVVPQMLRAAEQFTKIYPSPTHMNCRMCHFRNPCLSRRGGHNFVDELNTGFVISEPWYIQRRRQRQQTT